MILAKTMLTRKPLNEADESKYGFSPNILEPNGNENNPMRPQEEQDAGETNDVVNNGQTDQVDPNTTEVDDPTVPVDDEDEYGEEDMNQEGDVSEEDMSQDTQKEIDFKILSSLPSKKYKLNNVNLYAKFQKLIGDVDNYVNNTIMNIKPVTSRQIQALGIVHENLINMMQEIKDYLSIYSNSYENNEITYATFLKRYIFAVDTVKQIKDDMNKNE